MELIASTFRSRLIALLVFSSLALGTSALGQGSGSADAPVDFNGDGKTDFSILRADGFGGQYWWWTLENGTGNMSATPFGIKGIDSPVPADYDGDGRDDIAVFRAAGPEAGTWYIMLSSSGTVKIERFGQLGDNATIVNDFDGDGIDDLAVYRINSAQQGPGQAHFIYRGTRNNSEGNLTYVPWGMRYGTQSDQADDPYVGDFDGDGRADFGIQRRADTTITTLSTPAVFHILTATGQVSHEYFGWAGDRVVPGDYDGDGKTDICVARGFNTQPGQTTWFIRYSSGAPDSRTQFGSGFGFAQGDYDGDGKTDLGYFMNITADNEQVGFWYLSSANNNQPNFVRWGSLPEVWAPGAGDIPTAVYNNR